MTMIVLLLKLDAYFAELRKAAETVRSAHA